MLAWIIAAVTMTLGNTVALLQENLKRLLAYSSIAHAGYLMIGVTVAFANGRPPAASTSAAEGILFYLVAYALMTLGAFGVIIALSTPERPVETVDDLAGLGRTHPRRRWRWRSACSAWRASRRWPASGASSRSSRSAVATPHEADARCSGGSP